LRKVLVVNPKTLRRHAQACGLNTSRFTGLTETEALENFKRDDPNELPSARKRRVFHIAFSVSRESMFLLLIAGDTIYLSFGDQQEALLLIGFVVVIIGIRFYQERKTEPLTPEVGMYTKPL
jgi:P-type Ca2+ transporter type 2C